MRTTVDLPDELMRAAKARAATRGESLKELFERAVSTEIGRPQQGRRVSFPLVKSTGPHKTQDEIDAILATEEEADDMRRGGLG